MNTRSPSNVIIFRTGRLWTALFIFSFLIAAGLFIVTTNKNLPVTALYATAVLLPQIFFAVISFRRIKKYCTEQQNKQDQQQVASYEQEAADTEDQTEDQQVPQVQSELAAAEKNIAIRSQLIRSVSRELCSSISESLSSTTEPISAELLSIRKTSENFLAGIRMYDEEIRNRTALTQVRSESDLFNKDLEGLSQTVENVFSTLDNRISKLKTVSAHIGDIAGDISEISEKVRILSFNASIEAARAGSAGSGFRIIAGEIKKLSADTEARLVEIGTTLKETKTIFDNIGSGLSENRIKMLEVVTERKNGFGTFEQLIEGYYPRLEQMYTGVTDVIASLSKSMDVISPVVQLHEITSQEIGNLYMVADDFCDYIDQTLAEKYPDTVLTPEAGDAQSIAVEIRKRLTTKDELRALERGIQAAVPEVNVNLGINDTEIEFF
ncbi:MAG: methyl-accepting chemotaxis protein [Treponema sp.]|nr:methyl-accepting chemotaxis protein [Treponema sp.]